MNRKAEHFFEAFPSETHSNKSRTVWRKNINGFMLSTIADLISEFYRLNKTKLKILQLGNCSLVCEGSWLLPNNFICFLIISFAIISLDFHKNLIANFSFIN